MVDKTLVSMENAVNILQQVVSNIKTKIYNEDISLPYTQQLSKSSYIKIDGLGTMYLSNNSNYVELGNISKSNIDISKIYDIFSIKTTPGNDWVSATVATMPTARYSFGCVQYNGKVYCIGGKATSVFNKVEIYDIANNTWTTGAPMPTARDNFGCIQYNGKIYCIAGNGYKSIEVYDINSNTWSASINYANTITSNKYCFGCVCLNKKIYCIGGYENGHNMVEVYDITSNTWNIISYMPSARSYFGCITYNNKIYCFGGFDRWNPTKNVQVYDVASNTWSTDYSVMPNARTCAGCIEHNGKIYNIAGGVGVDVYDISINKYNTYGSIPSGKNKFGCVKYDNKIYCIGGDPTTGLTETFQLSYTEYDVPLPQYIQDKLNKIVNNASGTKVLSNDGSYKTIVANYNTMDNTQITNSLNIILNL